MLLLQHEGRWLSITVKFIAIGLEYHCLACAKKVCPCLLIIRLTFLKPPEFLVFCKSFINCSIEGIFKCHVLKTGNLFNLTCCLYIYSVHHLKVNSFDKAAKPEVKWEALTGISLATAPPGDFATLVPWDTLVEFLIC